jgi:hypothetical protein
MPFQCTRTRQRTPPINASDQTDGFGSHHATRPIAMVPHLSRLSYWGHAGLFTRFRDSRAAHLKRTRVPPLTSLITTLPQHSRPLPWGHPGLFTRLGNSREGRQAEFHQYSANLRNCPVPSRQPQRPHRPTPPENPLTVQRDAGPSALHLRVCSRHCRSTRGRFPGVIPDCLHVSETHAGTDKRSFTMRVRSARAAQSLPANARHLTGTSQSRHWHHSAETNRVIASRITGIAFRAIRNVWKSRTHQDDAIASTWCVRTRREGGAATPNLNHPECK